MENSAEKIRLAGNPNVMVCERGTMFGYSKLSSPFQIFFVSTEFSILDILKSHANLLELIKIELLKYTSEGAKTIFFVCLYNCLTDTLFGFDYQMI